MIPKVGGREVQKAEIVLHEDSMRQYMAGLDRELLTAAEEVALARSIEIGVLAQQRRDHGGVTEEDRILLAVLADEGNAAFRAMVTKNLRLVLALARGMSRETVAYGDLAQRGNLGLISAIHRFDYAKGIKFSTYASWWIRNALSEEISRSRTIRLPAKVLLDVNRVARARSELSAAHGREPMTSELAEELDISIEELGRLESLTREPISLSTFTTGDALRELQDDLVDPAARSVEGEAMHSSLVSGVVAALASLPPTEADVVRLRFGLGENKGEDYVTIAAGMDITVAHVRHLERVAFSKLSHPSRRALLRPLIDAIGD